VNGPLEDWDAPEEPAAGTPVDVTALARRVVHDAIVERAAAAAREALDRDSDDLEAAIQDAVKAAAAEITPAAPELFYPTLEAFIEDYLVLVYRRALSGPSVTWCPEWWRHAEAIIRLDALWRAWETLRLEPGTGMSVWLRDHADHHMPILLDADGPFKGCEPGAHSARPLAPLPFTPPPPGVVSKHASRTDTSDISRARDAAAR
jgi:hypothetical protein